jgi:hypothetical protein
MAEASRESAPAPRSSRRSRRRSRGGGWLKWSVGSLVVLLALAGGGQAYLKHYLSSAAFREKIAASLGRTLQAEVSLPELKLGDNAVQVRQLAAQGSADAAFHSLRVEEISANVEPKVFGKVLPIPEVRVGRVKVELPTKSLIPFPVNSGRSATAGKRSSGFFDKQPQLGVVLLESVDVDYLTPKFGLTLRDMPLKFTRGQSDAQWALSSHSAGEKASLAIPSLPQATFAIADLEARLESGRLSVSECVANIRARKARAGSPGQFHLSGFAETQRMEWRIAAAKVPLADWLEESWLKRVGGELTFNGLCVGSPQDMANLRLDVVVEVQQAFVQGLPFLETLAEQTKSLEFTKLSLQNATAQLHLQGDAWLIDQVVLESKGLLKLTGQLRGRGDLVEGVFEVGAAPGRLRSIDGAEQKVFTRSADGYLWAQPPMRVWGKLDDLQEDLGKRMQDAWFGQQIDNVIDLATKHPEKTLEQGAKLLEQAPGLIDRGAKLLDGLLPRPK